MNTGLRRYQGTPCASLPPSPVLFTLPDFGGLLYFNVVRILYFNVARNLYFKDAIKIQTWNQSPFARNPIGDELKVRGKSVRKSRENTSLGVEAPPPILGGRDSCER